MDNKWFKDYIINVLPTNPEWINLNSRKLANFYQENYYDNEKYCYVHGEKFFNPIGMEFLTFDELRGTKYTLGIVKNNINKYTIVSALCYYDDYIMFHDQGNYITYLSTIETNKYFRNRGLAKELIKNSYKFIPHNQNILISAETEMGRDHNILDKTINIYKSNGFTKDIRSDMNDFDKEEYHKLVRKKY